MADGQTADTKCEIATRVTQVLGGIRVGAQNVLIEGKPAGNSTRWLFDIESVAKGPLVVPHEIVLEIQLLDPRSHKAPVVFDVLSCALTAKDTAFYSARPYYETKDDSTLILRFNAVPAVSFRVAVDVMHSATR